MRNDISNDPIEFERCTEALISTLLYKQSTVEPECEDQTITVFNLEIQILYKRNVYFTEGTSLLLPPYETNPINDYLFDDVLEIKNRSARRAIRLIGGCGLGKSDGYPRGY